MKSLLLTLAGFCLGVVVGANLSHGQHVEQMEACRKMFTSTEALLWSCQERQMEIMREREVDRIIRLHQ